MKKNITPYKNSSLSKKQQVSKMFDNIASSYDFLNHFLSLGIDIYWRKKLVKKVSNQQPNTILDVATGTADLAIELLKVNAQKITGIDISKGMLDVGREKLRKKDPNNIITLIQADSETYHLKMYKL